tara:strand:- start:87 stop:371 length:285 start_codon:yes stop_codon:yes gene_type:complete
MKDNKLIAEFMGVPQGKHTHFMVEPFALESYADVDDLKYDASWDWLMPVLKKINLHLHPDTYGLWRMINVPTEYTIEEVHAQVVEFIKTYNDGQ